MSHISIFIILPRHGKRDVFPWFVGFLWGRRWTLKFGREEKKDSDEGLTLYLTIDRSKRTCSPFRQIRLPSFFSVCLFVLFESSTHVHVPFTWRHRKRVPFDSFAVLESLVLESALFSLSPVVCLLFQHVVCVWTVLPLIRHRKPCGLSTTTSKLVSFCLWVWRYNISSSRWLECVWTVH